MTTARLPKGGRAVPFLGPNSRFGPCQRSAPPDVAAGGEGLAQPAEAPAGAEGGREPPRRAQIVAFVAPPSISRFCPTTNPACTEHRNAQAAPNSAAVP